MSPDRLRSLRERLGLSQAAFAERYALNRRTVEKWELYGIPERGTRDLLLSLIELEPEIIAEMIVRLGKKFGGFVKGG